MFPSQTGVIPPLVNTVFIYISKQHSTIDANMQSWKGSCGEPDIHITHVLEVPNPSLLQELDTVKQQVSSQDTSSYVSFKKPKQFLCPLCNSDGGEDNQEIHLKVLLISNFCLFKLRTFSTVCELKKGASFASELDDQHLFVNIHENAPHSSHKERNNVILGQHELEMEESPVFLFKIY